MWGRYLLGKVPLARDATPPPPFATHVEDGVVQLHVVLWAGGRARGCEVNGAWGAAGGCTQEHNDKGISSSLPLWRMCCLLNTTGAGPCLSARTSALPPQRPCLPPHRARPWSHAILLFSVPHPRVRNVVCEAQRQVRVHQRVAHHELHRLGLPAGCGGRRVG